CERRRNASGRTKKTHAICASCCRSIIPRTEKPMVLRAAMSTISTAMAAMSASTPTRASAASARSAARSTSSSRTPRTPGPALLEAGDLLQHLVVDGARVGDAGGLQLGELAVDHRLQLRAPLLPRLVGNGDDLVVERLHRVEARLVPLRSEEHTSELQSRENLVCRLLLEKKNIIFIFSPDTNVK